MTVSLGEMPIGTTTSPTFLFGKFRGSKIAHSSADDSYLQFLLDVTKYQPMRNSIHAEITRRREGL